MKTTVDASLGHSAANGLAVLNGLDEKGLDNLTVSPITCSQFANAITASADVLPHFVPHSITGTISVGGVFITGVGTKFLDEVSPGDLIGSTAWDGYVQVASVESDTALTTVAFAVTGPGGSAGTVFHNATVQPNNAAIEKVTAINAAGTTIVVPTSTTHAAGSPLTIGVHAAATWLAVWLIDDGATPGLLLSTQHETLLAPPTGYTSFRRVGWIYNETTAPLLREIFYPDGGIDRHAVYEMSAQPAQVLVSDPNPLVWTDIDFSAVAPRTCRRLEVTVTGSFAAGLAQARIFFRERNTGDAALNRGRRLGLAAAEAQDQVFMLIPCDGAQNSQYVVDDVLLDTFVELVGFTDVL